MTAKEILKNNKMIAEFMGYHYYQHPNKMPGYRFEIPEGKIIIIKHMMHGEVGKRPYLCRKHRELMFNSSWNWLMPVIEKIEQDHVVRIQDISCWIWNYNEYIDYGIRCNEGDKLSSTYKAVCEYIQQNKSAKS